MAESRHDSDSPVDTNDARIYCLYKGMHKMAQMSESEMLLAIRETVTEALRDFAVEMRKERLSDIALHEARCPWGLDYRETKARLFGFLIGCGALGGSLGAGIATVLGKLL